MVGSFARITVAVLIGVSVLALTALPVAALKVQDLGMYSSFQWGVSRTGVGIVDRMGAGNPRLSVAVVSGEPAEEIAFTVRSIGCAGTPKASNRLFRVTMTTDANGDVFETRALSPSLNFGAARSIWADIDGDVACGIWITFEEVPLTHIADRDADGALSFGPGNGQLLDNLAALVEKLPNNRARVTVLANGLEPGDDYTIRGANRPCGTSPTSTRVFVEWEDIVLTSQFRGVIAISQTRLDSLRSIRVRNDTQGKNVGCVPLSLIDLLP